MTMLLRSIVGGIGVAIVGTIVGVVAIAASATATAAPRPPPLVEGLVERVFDGDTVRVAPDDGSTAVEIDLAGIDAPELCQEGGEQSRLFLTDLLIGRKVKVALARGVRPPQAKVYLGDEEVNRRVVEEGHAWSIRVRWDRGPYMAQERVARALRRGLHRANANPEMPRDFRQRHGPCLE